MCSNESYALKSLEEREHRKHMLDEPHMAVLKIYLENLRSQYPDKQIPWFDPCDGGIHTKVLFLLEAPGPKATESDFISRNNPDQTAKNMNELMLESGISRKDTLLWNIVPWYVGDGKKIRPVIYQEIKSVLPHIKQLFELLPELKIIVLGGRKAQRAESFLQGISPLPVSKIFHPSPRVFNLYPAKKALTQLEFKFIAQFIQNN